MDPVQLSGGLRSAEIRADRITETVLLSLIAAMSDCMHSRQRYSSTCITM